MWPRARNIMGHIEHSSHFGSDAFPLEHLQNIPKESFHKNIEAYLGEYRFAISRYSYELDYASDQLGTYHLIDPHDNEAMSVKAFRAVEKRRALWKNESREVAEYEGLQSLDEQLYTARDGSVVVWTSPPGAPKDGYGDYGFFFIGKVSACENNTKKIDMTAYRIDNQTIDQCSQAISQLTRSKIYFQTPEECIANPKIIPYQDLCIMSSILQDTFNFTCDFENERLFTNTMKILEPSILSFIDMVYKGASKEQIQYGFYALENYAIALRQTIKEQFYDITHINRRLDVSQEIVPFHTLVHYFGFSPPPLVAGSCGSTGVKSSNIFNNSLSSLFSLFPSSEYSEHFTCPSCHKESTPPVGDNCPKCGITKDQAEKKGMTTC